MMMMTTMRMITKSARMPTTNPTINDIFILRDFFDEELGSPSDSAVGVVVLPTMMMIGGLSGFPASSSFDDVMS